MTDVTKRATGSWHVALRGLSPRTGGQDWREAIRDAVNQTYPNAPFSPPPEGTRFRLDLEKLEVASTDEAGLDLTIAIVPRDER